MKTTRPPRAVSRIKPCLVVYNDPEGGLVVMVDTGALATPGIWGIAVADIVQHITNAHVTQGMAYAAVREDIIYYLLAELNQPSARAASGEPDWQEEGFTLDARAEAEAEAEAEDEE